MDCLIKHHNLIANPRYGLLGLVTMCYQLMVELLGPIFWVIYTVLLIEKNMLSFLTVVFVGYVLLQIGLAIFAAYIDIEKNKRSLLKWMPKLILTTFRRDGFANSDYGSEDSWNDYISLAKTSLVDLMSPQHCRV